MLYQICTWYTMYWNCWCTCHIVLANCRPYSTCNMYCTCCALFATFCYIHCNYFIIGIYIIDDIIYHLDFCTGSTVMAIYSILWLLSCTWYSVLAILYTLFAICTVLAMLDLLHFSLCTCIAVVAIYVLYLLNFTGCIVLDFLYLLISLVTILAIKYTFLPVLATSCIELDINKKVTQKYFQSNPNFQITLYNFVHTKKRRKK